MMLTGIKNIVFDLGGVLVDLDGKRCIDAFDAIGCHAISDYVRLHRTEDLFYDIEIGHTTTAEFCREVRSITPHSTRFLRICRRDQGASWVPDRFPHGCPR